MANKETKIVIAGFGGQGVVLAGNILARAAVIEGKNVTGMVSYGVEMRGGTANATVVISDEEIASPCIESPNAAMILNQPSLDKFEDVLEASSVVLLNSSLMDREIVRNDIRTATVEATAIARELGNVRVANIVALGAFVKSTGVVKVESLAKAIEQLFAEKKPVLIEINIKALERGVAEVH